MSYEGFKKIMIMDNKIDNEDKLVKKILFGGICFQHDSCTLMEVLYLFYFTLFT